MSVDMVTKKTSLALDEALWLDFQVYSMRTTGSARKASEKAEEALREYMVNHPLTDTNTSKEA